MEDYADGRADGSRKRGREDSEEESEPGSESGSEFNHLSIEEMAAEMARLKAELERMHAEQAVQDREADEEDRRDIHNYMEAIGDNKCEIREHTREISRLMTDNQDMRKKVRLQPKTYAGPDPQRHKSVLRRTMGTPALRPSTHRSERRRV